MISDRLQWSRFERKYFLSGSQALLAREFLRSHLTPDVNTRGGPDGSSYPVHSLYLDSADLLTYWAWVCCEKRRFKLRIRFYDESPDSPLFFEIKRRENDCIVKQRALVRRSAAPALLAGQMPAREHLVAGAPENLAALQTFCQLMRRIAAKPLVHIAYQREAWISKQGNSVRVTFDRQVCAAIQRQADFKMDVPNAIAPFGQRVILELKFTEKFPDWCREFVQRLNLVARGIPKYCSGVEALLGDRVTAHEPPGMKQKLADLAFCVKMTCLERELAKRGYG